MAEKYADKITFLDIYVTEPHPASPDVGPMRGYVSTMSYSKYRQPKTYADRVSNAKTTLGNINKAITLLVDDLTPQNKSGNNPVWCTYGPNPNGAWLIGQDGKVALGQQWFTPTEMETAIQNMVGPSPGPPLPPSPGPSPGPAPPAGSCNATLDNLCGALKAEPQNCSTCCLSHLQEERAAGCQGRFCKAYCGVGPHPPSPSPELVV